MAAWWFNRFLGNCGDEEFDIFKNNLTDREFGDIVKSWKAPLSFSFTSFMSKLELGWMA